MKINLHNPLRILEIGKRTNQEDYVYPPSPASSDRLFVLCDGMGGHSRGEVASQRVAEGIGRWYKKYFKEGMVMTDVMFEEAFEYSCQYLDEADPGDDDGPRMGTTLTFLCFHQRGCLAAHVGDSRIYHIRPSERRLLYKSKDHSLVCELYEAGEISFSEMSTSSQRNVITRAVMPGQDNRVEADVVHITDIKPGDYFYLCSDGMLEKMGDDELIDLFSARTSDEEKRKQLIQATAGNKDNHSAIIIHVADVKMEKGDDPLAGDEAESPYNALLMRKDDDDEEGTITIVGDSDENEEHTAYTPVRPAQQTPAAQQPSKQQQENKKDSTGVSSWLIAVTVAAIVAALVAVVYYYI